METYQEFLDRCYSFEIKELKYNLMYPDNPYFKGNPSLSQKVNCNNTFKAFYGDTIVFALDKTIKETLTKYVDLLYQSASECFCEKLVSNTFHVTLHDLSNSPNLHDVAETLFHNECKVIEQKKELQKYQNATIKLKSSYIFNMVNTSLVLGLIPADKESYRQLMELYSIFDCVQKLNYPFTPHVTLAYYNINGFPIQSAKNLENTVLQLNMYPEIIFDFCVDSLYYQKFKSMNHYIDVFNFGTLDK